MVLTTMTTASGPEESLLFLLPFASSLPPLVSVFALGAALLWLCPGGPAWALSRCRRPPSGPTGVVTALSSPVAHRMLAALSRTVNGEKSLMAFSVGTTRLVVSSQPDTAREILTNPAFGDRPVKEAARHLLFDRAMGFASSVDAHWRGLRRLAASHLFGPRRVAASAPHRASIGANMINDVATHMGNQDEVTMRRVLHAASLNHIMSTVFGKRYDFTTAEGHALEEMVTEGYDLLGGFNWADYIPLLKWLDPQGVRARCDKLVQKVNVFVGGIIEEHRARRAAGFIPDEDTGDFVDVLLDLEGEDKLSDSDMITVLWEMIFRGADTVAILMEWVMARMVLHPEIQAKAQAELDAVVGKDRIVEDADVASLSYIQNIVKETLRMHPPGPLLSWARLAVQDAHVGGHLVPAGTTAMVNMWSIAHDPAIWAEPEKFCPERFQEEDVSVLGSDLRLAPFGAGRRACPGKMMALTATYLWLAQLLQKFEWAPTTGGVDLSENLGMSLEMAKPLVCKVAARA